MTHPIKHFNTITHHRHKVIKHCFLAGIGFQGLLHDLSKYSLTEFVPGAKCYQGTRSPNDRERELYGYSKAWMHHKGRNRHHFEYWVDISPVSKVYEPVRMPMRYLKEMFCDRIAACKIYKGKEYTDSDPINYFTRVRTRDKMHPDTARLLEEWLTMLSQKGEKETFKYIRSIKNDTEYGNKE